MTQEDKELLLRDLCTRLLYDLKCKLYLDKYCAWNPEYDKILADAAKVRPELPSKIREKTYTLYGIEGNRAILLEFEDYGYGVPIEFIKPYLRPMSSMTEEEKEELKSKCIHTETEEDWEGVRCDVWGIQILDKYDTRRWDNPIWPSTINIDAIDWLNSHHFDYRGLIEKCLALEAPEGMYKFKKK